MSQPIPSPGHPAPSSDRGDPGPYVEPGTAFMALSARHAGRVHDVVVIGAGQAGLSVGYYLKQRGLSFVIVDGAERVGDSWRRRWDSLRLFSPARLDGLVGLPFPAHPDHFPSKDEMADYLEHYARHFELPVRMGMRVERVHASDGGYVVEAGGERIFARQVVVAMASYQKPKLPEFAAELAGDIQQLHSNDYRTPAQLQPGPVLVVGAGNSGAEIGIDVAKNHRVFLAGRDVGHVPFRIGSWFGRKVLVRLVMRVMFHRVLSLATPIGRKVRPKFLGQGGPLVRTRPQEVRAAGIERVARVAGVRGGKPVLEDGRVLDVANVLWCTGFHPGFAWLELPVCDATGYPRQTRGVADDAPGLYFVGLNFLYAASSSMVHGVQRDAAHVVEQLAKRAAQTQAVASALQPSASAA